MFTEKVAEVPCWPTGVSSIKEGVGRSRLEGLRGQNFECWRSTSVATESREAQASPTR
jgi:hypothetical protein